MAREDFTVRWHAKAPTREVSGYIEANFSGTYISLHAYVHQYLPPGYWGYSAYEDTIMLCIDDVVVAEQTIPMVNPNNYQQGHERNLYYSGNVAVGWRTITVKMRCRRC